MREHSYQVRVYYADTDPLAVVHHANFIKYLEQARTEALRELGFTLPSLEQTYGVKFAVTRLHVDYLRPARVDDLLTIVTWLTRIRRASLVYSQEIYVAEELIVEAEIQLVGVNDTMGLQALPKELYARLQNCM